LKHENIVRLVDVAVGQRTNKIFLVMEFCELVTLLKFNLKTEHLGSRFNAEQDGCAFHRIPGQVSSVTVIRGIGLFAFEVLCAQGYQAFKSVTQFGWNLEDW
jgi:serine/threonine protein kinase